MDKETLSNYGWIVILVLILAVLLALATPFGNFVAGAIKATTAGFFGVNQNALDIAGIATGDVFFEGDEPLDPALNPNDGTKPKTGDTYYTDDYKYMYNARFKYEHGLYDGAFEIDESLNGWGVAVLNTKKTEYEPILETINGEPVVSMSWLFWRCTRMSSAPIIPRYVTDLEGTFEHTCISTYHGSTDEYGDFSNYVIPNGVTNMSCTFWETAVYIPPAIPNSVTNMYSAFKDSSLRIAPTIPDGVTNLDYIFYGCEYLTTVPNLPTKVTSMKQAFYGCESLTSVPDLGNYTDLTSLEQLFYNCSSLVTAPTIPNSVTNLDYIFYGCKSLTTVPNLPTNVTSMNRAFYGCESLTSVPDLGNYTDLTSLEYLFYNCSSLVTAPTIPNSVTSLKYTFSGCKSLTTVPNFPTALTDVDYIFSGCTSLTNVADLDNCTQLTKIKNLFYNCSSLVQAPKLPNSITDMSGAFYGCSNLTTAPVIPYGVTNMSSTFSGCKLLTNAPTIPNSVTNMSSTFSNCRALTTAPTIPNSVTNIDSTFYYCDSLTTVPNFPANITSLNKTFYYCRELASLPNLPEGLTSITDAFYMCKLGSIVIPSTVTEVKGDAFNNCNKLNSIVFTGTVEQWKEIAFARSDWNRHIPAKYVQCSNGNICFKHTGGRATCIQKALCTVCGDEYGSFGCHYVHNGTCTLCGEQSAIESMHSPYEGNFDNVVLGTWDYSDAKSVTIEITYQTVALSVDWVCLKSGDKYITSTGKLIPNEWSFGGQTKTTETFTTTALTGSVIFTTTYPYNYYGVQVIVTPNY